MQPVVVGTGIGGAMILNSRLHRGKHHLGGEFGYMLLSEPAETLGNGHFLLRQVVLFALFKLVPPHRTGMVRRSMKLRLQEMKTCQKQQVSRWNLAKGLLNIQYLFDPDVVSLGGSISQNPDFIQGVRSAIAYYVERYEEYSVVARKFWLVPTKERLICMVL